MLPDKTDDPEIWLPVRGCERFYEVSNHGRVRRILTSKGKATSKIVPPQRSSHGYLRVGLVACGRTYTRSVARLVLFAFHGIPTIPNATASHLHPNKHNNRWDNLEWESMEDNLARKKLFPDPYGRGTKRLSIEQVREIRRRWDLGESHLDLATEFKASESAVLAIVQRDTWRCAV